MSGFQKNLSRRERMEFGTNIEFAIQGDRISLLQNRPKMWPKPFFVKLNKLLLPPIKVAQKF
jgi:hypothetical protein